MLHKQKHLWRKSNGTVAKIWQFSKIYVEQNRRLSNNQFSKIYVEQNGRFSKIYMEKNRRFSKIYVDLPDIAYLRPVPDTDPLHLLSFQRQPALRVPWITRRTHGVNGRGAY
jgi:hypothetical protein